MRKFYLRVQRVVMTLLAKMRFGNKLKSEGIVGFKFDTELIIRKGTVEIGRKTGFNSRVTLAAVDGGHICIGKDCFLNSGCILVSREKIDIGDGTQVGPNTVLYDHNHKFGTEGIEKGYKTGEIIIGKKCWIGANATVLNGTHIGDGCVIGAGAVVKGEIPAHSLVTSDRGLKIKPIVNRD